MKCVKCNHDVNIKSQNMTVTLKERKVTYLQKSCSCSYCGFAFFTPAQLDINSLARKEAYEQAKKNIAYK